MQRFREPVSGFTHLGGAIAAIIGMILLVALTREDTAKMISMGVYGLSATALFLASTVMHLSYGSPRLQDWLRSLDHAAIYLLIAGTYTPICYNVLTGTWRWGMLGLIWLLALGGIIYKLATRHRAHTALSTAFYVAMGWAALLVLPRALELLPLGALLLIVAGGVIYSLGAVVFATRRPNFHPQFGHHEVWHLFVLAGFALHFAAILFYVV